MGLEDIVDDKEEEKEKENVEELKDELGVEDEEDLEQLNDQLRRMSEVVSRQDKKIEELENNLMITQGALARVIQDMSEMYEHSEVQSPQEDVDESFNYDSEDDDDSSGWGEWQ